MVKPLEFLVNYSFSSKVWTLDLCSHWFFMKSLRPTINPRLGLRIEQHHLNKCGAIGSVRKSVRAQLCRWRKLPFGGLIILGFFFFIRFRNYFWIPASLLFLLFLLLCFPAFPASLLFCFFAFLLLLLLAFSAFLLFCFSASLLFCFSAFLFFLFLCFSAFPAFLPASLLFCFSCFFAFLLFCFCAFPVSLLLCFFASLLFFLLCLL